MSEEAKKKEEEEKKKKEEEEKSKNKSWREQAKAEGYSFIPTVEFDEMKKGESALKDLRTQIPDEFKGKEGEFFTEATSAMQTIRDGGSTDEAVKTELTTTKRKLTTAEKSVDTLTTENTGLKKQNKVFTVWGHIDGMQRTKNVSVHSRLIEDSVVESFPLGDYDTSTEDGRKALGEAVWEKIIEPAWKDQQEIARASNGSVRRSGSDDSSEGDRKTDDETKIPTIGSLS